MTLKSKALLSVRKTGNAFIDAVPIIVGVLLLTSLVMRGIRPDVWKDLFARSSVVDSLVGAAVGSIASGHPIASYVLGGELLASGISLTAVTALVVSWVTVGIVQLPAEAMVLGTRFAIYRNVISFVSAVVIAFLTVYTLRFFG